MTSDGSPTGNRTASLVWLVSFGDLLTLLLTFFISAIAHHGATSPASEGDSSLTIENNEQFEKDQELQVQHVPTGTMIAAGEEGKRAGAPVLYLDDIDLQSSRVEKVRLYLRNAISQSRGITLEACSPYQDDALQGVHLRVQQTLRLVAQESPQALGMVKVLPSVVHQCEEFRSEENPLAVARLVSFRNGRGRGRREKSFGR